MHLSMEERAYARIFKALEHAVYYIVLYSMNINVIKQSAYTHSGLELQIPKAEYLFQRRFQKQFCARKMKYKIKTSDNFITYGLYYNKRYSKSINWWGIFIFSKFIDTPTNVRPISIETTSNKSSYRLKSFKKEEIIEPKN